MAATEGKKFDLTQAVMAGMTLDDLLDFPSAFVPDKTNSAKKTVPQLPAYKPSFEVINKAQDPVKPKIGKPQVTVNIPIEHFKRTHFCCELCGQPPKFMCSVCSETYYCCEKHCLLDFHAIHKFVCVKLMIVRNPEVKHVQWRRFSKEEVAENIKMRKVILLHVANNMSRRHLIRGNYAFAIPCSLLAQKLVNEMDGLHCVQMIRPYLIMARAYLARRKVERSKFYTGLINYIKMNKLTTALPKECEMELERVLADQLIHENKFEEAKTILCSQIVDCCLRTGPDHHDLLYSLFSTGNCCFLAKDLLRANAFYDCFLQILSTNLLSEVKLGSLYLHQCIEEDLNPAVKLDKKLGLLQKQSCQWAHIMSEKDYEVYIRRETVLTYLRTIWIQFEAANRNEFTDIFPSLQYCVTMILFVCRQWREASDVYSEAIAATSPERQAEFREMQSVLGLLQKHLLHRTDVHKSDENAKAHEAVVDLQCPVPDRSLWRPDLVKFDVPDLPNEEDELGYTLQRIVKRIQKYKEEIKADQESAHVNRKSDLRRIGLI